MADFPVIISLSPVPQRNQNQNDFSDKADAFLGKLPTFRDQLNQWADILNALSFEIKQDVQAAEDARDDAASSAEAARVAGNIYPTIEAGLSSGAEFFSVVGSEPDELIRLYRNNDGTAEFINSYAGGPVGGQMVDTSTGTQTVVEALDSRVIYVSTVDDFLSLDTSSLVDGQAASVEGSNFRWEGGEWRPAGPVSVKAFGAVGDGITDDFEAVKAAVEFLPEGSRLEFPDGHYFTEYQGHEDEQNWIHINKNGINLVGIGEVVLENFLFYTHGSYGKLQNIDSDLSSGEQQIGTSDSNSFAEGDYVQLISCVNSYASDAGKFQLGSRNVTTLELRSVPFSEIHRVKSSGEFSFSIFDRVQFDTFKEYASGLSYPMPGITNSRVRRLDVVKNIAFNNLRFVNKTTNSFRSHLIRAAVDVVFDSCFFEAGSLPGAHIRCSDSKTVKMINCKSYRSPENITGSGWNSFFFGGGSEDISITGMESVGESQNIDFIPGFFSSDVGSTNDDVGSINLTVRNIEVSSSIFRNGQNGLTTHPGVYGATISSNSVIGCSTGFNIRSRQNIICNNKVETFSEGILLSAFHGESNISNNTLIKQSSETSRSWVGIHVSPMSSEIINDNRTKDVLITGNVFYADQQHPSNKGILFRHFGNGVPPTEGLEEFNDDFKTGLSQYLVQSNSFHNMDVFVNRWINGIIVRENTFRGTPGSDFYIYFATNSARNVVIGNYYLDANAQFIHVTDANDPSYPYSTGHVVIGNIARLPGTSTLVNTVSPQIIGSQ